MAAGGRKQPPWVVVGGCREVEEREGEMRALVFLACFTWMKMSQICLAMLISSKMNLKPIEIRHIQWCLAK